MHGKFITVERHLTRRLFIQTANYPDRVGPSGKRFRTVTVLQGTAVAQWLRYCATNRKVPGLIPDGVIGFFIDIILPIALRPWGRLRL